MITPRTHSLTTAARSGEGRFSSCEMSIQLNVAWPGDGEDAQKDGSYGRRDARHSRVEFARRLVVGDTYSTTLILRQACANLRAANDALVAEENSSAERHAFLKTKYNKVKGLREVRVTPVVIG